MPFVKSESIEIFYAEEGAGDPVVLIGGISSTFETWGRQIPALARQLRVIAPDNRGSGRTRVAGDDGDRAIARFADDVRALLDGLGLERVHLVGASMGGVVVQEFALRHPGRLRSLAILCSTFGGPHAVAAEPAVLEAMLRGSTEAAGPDEIAAAQAVLFHPESPAKRPDAIAFYAACKREHPHPPAEIARRAAAVGAFCSYDRLPALRVPTLVAHGAHDRLIPTENGRRLAARIPGAELRLFEDGGHCFFCECADEVNAALLEFMARH